MDHATVPRLLLCLPLLAPLACQSGSEGDDLPPGAFTSGPDDDGNLEASGTTTTSGSSDDGEGTTTSSTTTAVDSGSSDEGPVVLSHAEHILPIWTASCIDASCHDPDAPQAGLDLASDGVYERLCMGTHGFSGMSYIDCDGHDPQQSYAFRKIEGTHLEGISGGSGLPMPPTEPLTEGEIATLEAWIAGGALP